MRRASFGVDLNGIKLIEELIETANIGHDVEAATDKDYILVRGCFFCYVLEREGDAPSFYGFFKRVLALINIWVKALFDLCKFFSDAINTLELKVA